MDNLLFRAYSKTLKKYVTKEFSFFGEWLTFDMFGQIIAENWELFSKHYECQFIATNDFIIEQFTGVTDKNKANIFVGDVVLVNGTKRVGKYVTSVVFKDGCYMLKENKTYLLDSKCLIAATVIGNIHDNEDLLTGPKSKALHEAAIYGLSVAKTRFEKKE